jgi:5-aminopentanamidase
VKLALWQTPGFPADVVANLAALERTAQATATAGANLLLCPECWLCGYNIGHRVVHLAETRDGAAAERIARIAQRHRLAIVYGYAERDSASERIFNAVQAFGPDGAPLAHYRKTHLFGAIEHAAFVPGERFERPFEFEGFKIGLLICYDVEYPEAVRALALLGADLLLVPTALASEYPSVISFLVPARALENRIHIAYCNRSGVENGMQFLGGSCLVGIDGHVVASAGSIDALIIGEISQRAGEESAGTHSYHRDRRPELYGLLTSGSMK